MKVGVFDSGLGGLTVVSAIKDVFKGADLFYIADTSHAPYGPKNNKQILKRCLEVSQFLIDNYNIEVLIVACNTATSAAIKYLREEFPYLIVIGTEPGIKPALKLTKSLKIGVLATTATLKGDKYQKLVDELPLIKEIELFEQACPGLVEEIENGNIKEDTTISMLSKWLNPMKEQNVDTIVLGCTHYPLISNSIKQIMGNNVNLIETGTAIANRLKYLSEQKGHINEGLLKIFILYTGDLNINMVNFILEEYNDNGKIMIRKCKI